VYIATSVPLLSPPFSCSDLSKVLQQIIQLKKAKAFGMKATVVCTSTIQRPVNTELHMTLIILRSYNSLSKVE
jgi:hypothetical protein